MGREALCECEFAGATAKVKALLETNEIILRGDIRLTAPFHALQKVKVQSECLCFTIDKKPLQLHLGAKTAESWAKKIKTPLPSLADKLGITGKIVRTIGDVSDRALSTAIASAAEVSARNPHLILARVDTPESLAATLKEAKAQLARSIPIWLIYRKGPGHPLNESHIRSTLRSLGYMDTKVASVSPELTALRFNLSKSR
ncbi:MAG TPA: hypothetical protein VNU92_06070 [Edaphobacter sp.]|jgi:hypothetical protein|nr:hypothetical protein [Edaphobacter sp.]